MSSSARNSPLVIDPQTPVNRLSNSPHLSPGASTMTPIISNVSARRKDRSTARSNNKQNSLLNAATSSGSRRLMQTDPSASTRPANADSPTVIAGNHKNPIIKTKNSEDPPSDVSLDSGNAGRTTTTTTTNRSFGEDPEGSHITNWNNAKTLTKNLQPIQVNSFRSPPATSNEMYPINVEQKTHEKPSSKQFFSESSHDRQQHLEVQDSRDEQHDERRNDQYQQISNQRQTQPKSHDQRQEPPLSSPRSRRILEELDKRDDMYLSTNVGQKKLDSPRRENNKQNRSLLINGHSSFENTSHSVYTVGTSTHPSLQSAETYPSHPVYVRSRQEAASDGIFDRVHQCGDIICDTMAAVTTPRESNNHLMDTTNSNTHIPSIDDGGPVIARIVPNVSDVTGGTPFTEKGFKSENNKSAFSPTWLMSVFQKIQQEHEAEREQWQKDMDDEKGKKTAYKSELKSSLVSQLQWLENQVMSPAHLLPAISRSSTILSHESKYGILSIPSQEGVEITVDNAKQMLRIQHLEQALQETIEQHSYDRQQWYAALEEAAIVTATGEQLSMKQHEQLRAIQREAEDTVKQQRQQWKEKTRVLQELLALTEQQHQQEREQLISEQERLQTNVERLISEKNEIAVEFDRVLGDMQELTEDADNALKEASSQKEQATSALKLCNDFEEQASAALKEAEDFKDQAFKAQSEKIEMKQELDQWKNTAFKAQNEMLEMKQKLEQVRSSTNKTQLEVEQDLREQLEFTNQELNNAKEQASIALRLCSDYEEQMDITVKNASEWQTEVSGMKQDLENIRNEKANLESENQNMQEVLNKKQHEFEELQKETLLYNQELESARLEIKALGTEVETSTAQIESIKKELEAAQTALENSKVLVNLSENELVISKQETITSKEEISSLKHELTAAKMETVDVSIKLAETRREVESAQKEIKDLREQAADFTELSVSSQKQCRKLQKNLAEASPSDRDNRQRRTSRVFREHETTLDMEDELDRAIAERDLYKQEAFNNAESLEIASAELDMCKQENAAYQKQIAFLNNELDSNSSDRNIQDKLERITAERDSFRREANDLLDKICAIEKPTKDNQGRDRHDLARLRVFNGQRGTSSDLQLLKNLQNKLASAEADRDIYKKKSIEASDAARKVKMQLKDDRKTNYLEPNRETEPELRHLLHKQQKQLKEPADSELMKKYQESITKQNNLVEKIKDLELQRSNDKGSWKLTLEAALAESRKLGEDKKALENQVINLKEEVRQLKGMLHENQENYSIEALENSFASRRIAELEDKISQLEVEANERYNNLIDENHEIVATLRAQLDTYKAIDAAAMRNELLSARDENVLADIMDRGPKEWKTLVGSLNAFNHRLQDQNLELCNVVKDTKSLYDDMKTCRDHMIVDGQDRTRQSDDSLSTNQKDILNQLDKHRQCFSQALEELQKDIIVVKDKLDAPSSRTNDEENEIINRRLETIQHRLDSIMNELGQETEAINDYKHAVKSLVEETKQRDDKSLFIYEEQQELLLLEIDKLRRAIIPSIEKADTSAEEPLGIALIAELQRKEASLTDSKVELEKIREKLDEERTKRERAECSNAALQAQVTAYSDELMHLQSTTYKLLARLDDCDDAYIDPELSFYDELDYDKSWAPSPSKDATSPLLDEALALAEGFTDIMHRKTNSKTEPSAMEILECLSNMMDKQDSMEKKESSGRKKMISSSPKNERMQKGNGEQQKLGAYRKAPDYVEIIHATESSKSEKSCIVNASGQSSPRSLLSSVSRRKNITRSKIPHPSHKKAIQLLHTPLQLIVEQLYGRCELLERERLRLMEITLDLIESAKDADDAQLSEALEIARQKSTAEMTRVRDQSKVEQERIFHKVCNHCIQKGVLMKDIKATKSGEMKVQKRWA